MWNLYGKKYDLTNFIEKHPGGKFILEKSKGQEDITALFETYHAFSEIDKIKQTLDKYEIKDDTNEKPNEYLTDFSNYRELVTIVREKYPNRDSIKSTPFWWFYNIIIITTYLPLLYIAMVSKICLLYRCVLGLLAGIIEMGIIFNFMHDGSHYAISSDPTINNIITKLHCNWIMWNMPAWYNHHVYLHHSFTGDHQKDPDHLLYNFDYLFSGVIKILKPIFVHMKTTSVCILYSIIPGQSTVQTLVYFFGTIIDCDFLPKIAKYDFIDIAMILFKIYLFYCGGGLVSLLYLIGVNTTYYINIYGDHDFYETKIENAYNGDDWLKRQICNSGNFLNDNMIWTRMFSGINYQIEHHLFPNVSSIHYPEISKIVKKYCLENNLPYVHHPTLYSAYKSFSKRINYKVYG